jgi:hypothetical protein
MGRTITLSIAVLVVIGGTSVVLSDLSKKVRVPVHPLGGLNTVALEASDPHSEFDPSIPSLLGRYDPFGAFIATQPDAQRRKR